MKQIKTKLKYILPSLIVTILYIFCLIIRWKTWVSYLVLLGAIVINILLTNIPYLLSANSLFAVYFTYAVGFGPCFLLASGTTYNYDFFTLILGGLLIFSWGNVVAMMILNKKIYSKEDKTYYTINFLSRKNVLRIAYCISLLAAIYYVIINRNYLFGGDFNTTRIIAQSGNGIILYTMQLPILIIPMMYDLYYKGKQEGKKTISVYELLCMLVLSSVVLLFTGYRSPVLTMYLCLAILYIQKNKINNLKIICIGVSMVIAVEVLGIIRYNFSGSSISFLSLLSSLSTSLVVNCYNLSYVFNAFPANIPFQHGYTYLINIIMLRPGPDLDFTLWLKEQLGLSFSGGGVTPTILGEFYINFNIVGVYIGMFIWGIIGVWIFRYFKKHNQTFLGAFYVWQFAHAASGGIANVIVTVFLYTIIYWIIMMFPIYRNHSIQST